MRQSRPPTQLRLDLTVDPLWDRFPEEAKSQCLDLLTLLIQPVLIAEAEREGDDHERKDQH